MLDARDEWSHSSPGSSTPKKEVLVKVEERLGGFRSVFGSCGKEKPLLPTARIEARYLGCPARTVAAVLMGLPPTNLDTNICSTFYLILNDKSNWLTACPPMIGWQ
jgi:hypothetical protein